MTDIHEIDTTHPANSDPTTATDAEIADALDDRQLFNRTLLMKFNGFCRRCKQKNQRRRAAGLDEARERFRDGERVHIFAYYVREEEVEMAHAPPGYWRISKVICADHPVVPFGHVAAAGRHQVRGRANVEEVEGESHRLQNTTVEDRSPPEEGAEVTVVDERRQQFEAGPGSEHPEGVISVPIEEPEPAWPASEREWLEAVAEEHGPLEPTTGPAVFPIQSLTK